MKKYENYTSEEVKCILEHNDTITLLATGSIEQHGAHLPLSVDTVISQRICEEVLKNSDNLICLPPIYYAARSLPQSGGVNKQDASIYINGSNLISYFRDIFISLNCVGMKKLIIMNGHYENESFLCEAAESISGKINMHIIILSWWSLISKEFIDKRLTPNFSSWEKEHAGYCETSLMLYLEPSLVRFTNEEYEALIPLGIYKNKQNEDIHSLNNGVLSSSVGACKELGERLFHEIILNFESIIMPIME